jgi:signal transduction histidine kinase
MWGNVLSLGCVLFSFLVAVGWYEDVAELLAQQAPVMLFLADGLAFWVIFVLTLGILDTITRNISTIKVKYAEQVENYGNGVVLFLLSAAIYLIFLFGEEIGPVGENFGVDAPGDSVVIQMLRILSAGNLSAFDGGNQFDGSGNHRKLHLQRRQALMYNAMTNAGVLDSLLADEGDVDRMKRGGN